MVYGLGDAFFLVLQCFVQTLDPVSLLYFVHFCQMVIMVCHEEISVRLWFCVEVFWHIGPYKLTFQFHTTSKVYIP